MKKSIMILSYVILSASIVAMDMQEDNKDSKCVGSCEKAAIQCVQSCAGCIECVVCDPKDFTQKQHKCFAGLTMVHLCLALIGV